MTNTLGIFQPELLHIKAGTLTCCGGDQDWYPTEWQRRSGCGPTVCAQLLRYLSQTRSGCAALCAHDSSTQEGFLSLMEEVWTYITPGRMGVNSTSIFTQGAVRYGLDRHIPLHCRVLEIPIKRSARPSPQELSSYLEASFASDLPVAFLNLSNGALTVLENWHWVTLVSFNPHTLQATMIDQGKTLSLDLGLWLRTTLLAGGFVTVDTLCR